MENVIPPLRCTPDFSTAGSKDLMGMLSQALGVRALPERWQERPLWSVARERRGNKNVGMREKNLLSLSFGSVIRKDIESTGGLLPESFEGYQVVEPGDLIMRLTDLQNDKRSLRSGMCKERGIITSAYLALEPSGVDSRYFAYLMRAYDVAKVLYPLGGGLRQSLKFEDIRLLPIVLPPLEEQRRIADFLDDQVGRIDETISARKKQKILGAMALKTQIQVLTSHGSDASWRLGYAFQTGSGTTPSSERTELFSGSIPWVVSGDLNDSTVKITKQCVSLEALAEYSALKVFPTGTVLIAMYGATVGKTGLLGLDACMNQAVCALTERGPVLSKYLQYWLRGQRQSIIELATGGGQPNISQEVVRNLQITTGSVNWQADRVHQMDQNQEEQLQRERAIDQSVSLLEERKRALITSAVTGQLNVATARPVGFSLVPVGETRIDASTKLVTAKTGKRDDPST